MVNENIFSDMERDVIGEVMNICLGSSATSLSALLGKRVEITVPKVNVINAADFSYENLEPAIGVEINYIQGLDGTNLMIWKRTDAKAIIEILLGQEILADEFAMDEINTSAICEVMNQMMGSAATALSDFLGKPVNISTPSAYEIEDRIEFKNKYFNNDDIIVAVNFELFIEGSVQSQFIYVMPLVLARNLVSSFIKGMAENEKSGNDGKDTKSENKAAESEASESKDSADEGYGEEEAPEVEAFEDEEEVPESEEEAPEAEEEAPKAEEEIPEIKEERRETKLSGKTAPRVQSPVQKNKPKKAVVVRPLGHESFEGEEEPFLGEQSSNLALIMTVPLEISVEIGRCKKQIKDILEFTQGTIIELNKQAGAPVDVIVNGQLIAKGEVVVVNDNFGVRVSEIVKKDELIKLTL